MKQIIALLTLFCAINIHAQIGYQVSLLNKATGEPRANETVSVDIKITDSKDNIIFSGSQSATTNDFGVLSLSVGNENTFDNVDWNNLPLFVSATVDNVLLGCSQILSVPVAEYAKHTGSLTKEILKSKTWKSSKGDLNMSLSFTDTKVTSVNSYYNMSTTHKYYISNNIIIIEANADPNDEGEILYYIPENNSIVSEYQTFE